VTLPPSTSAARPKVRASDIQTNADVEILNGVD